MKTYSVILFICILSDIGCFSNCHICKKEYTRTKRAKYYSHAPPKFFKIPPMSTPVIGPFSYTPPPYLTNSGVAGNPRHYQVSNHNNVYANGLADEDIQNIVKYLTKQDLEKIVELAAEQDAYSQRHRAPTQDKHNIEYNTNQYNEHRPTFKEFNEEYDVKRFPYSKVNDDIKLNTLEYRRPLVNSFQDNPDNLPYDSFYKLQTTVNDMSLPEQASFLDAYIQKELNGFKPDKIINSNSLIMQESLSRPTNLREQDYEISSTNNLPNVLKAVPSSYKLENFGDLPLMNFDDSKLDTVNSYNVPHYTVTQPKSAPQQPSLETLPPLESAPSRTAGRDQSDAHLVAIKIWTHKSKGTAYTVNDDGSLTLEKPIRSKFKYP